MPRRFTNYELARSVAIGLVTALLVSVVMVNAYQAGLVPLPEPLPVAFAGRLFGAAFQFSNGILLQFGWITFWSLAYVLLVRHHTFVNALRLAFALWVGVLVIFFPLVGWGVFGVALGPGLVPPLVALVPHLLFAVIVWALGRHTGPADVVAPA